MLRPAFPGALLLLAPLALAQPNSQLPNLRIPIPVFGPEVVATRPGVIEPLTAEEKAKLMLWKSVSLAQIGNRLLLAGWDQWSNEPVEWGQGWDAYGQRVGDRFGRAMIRNSIMLATDIAFKTDPRYDRCLCSGVWPRVAHAARRVVVARKDDGGETVNFSRFAGAYVTPWIADQWLPPSQNTTERKLTTATTYLAWKVASNTFAEFWPDIRARIFRRGGQTQTSAAGLP